MKRALLARHSFLTSDSTVLVATTVATAIVRLVSTMILTRLLTPEAFGVVSIVASVFVTLALLTDLGLQAFVVRSRAGDDPEFLDVVWTISLCRNIVIGALIILVAQPLSALLEKPSLQMPFAVASLTFFATALDSLGWISATRRREVKKVSLAELSLTLMQVIFTIALAAALRNVWALVIAMVFQSLARTAFSYLLFPRPRRKFVLRRKVVRELVSFSKFIIPSSIITLLISQSDKLVLAKLFSLTEFGMYAIAHTIAQFPAIFVAAYGSRMLGPLFAEVWRNDPKALPVTYYSTRRMMSCLYAFGSGGIAGSAPLIIELLYDDRYEGAALYLMILGAGGMLALSNQAAVELLVASGRFSATVALNAWRLLWLALAGTLGYLLLGTIGVVVAVGSMELPPYLYNLVILRRMGVLRLREEGLQLSCALSGVAAGLSIAAAASWLVRIA